MKNSKLYLIILSTALTSSMALAEPQVTGKLTYESARFTKSGATNGVSTTHDKDIFKNELSARIYIDGDLDALKEGSTYHLELQGYNNDKAVTDNDGHDSYTQRDALREAYVDTSYEDWSIRTGKQQVVWGTADGAKLLDIINPTDFTEMAQNQMEDSRIPVWMINAEKPTEDGGNFQVIISQPKENIFAGLNRNINTSTRSNGAYVYGTGISDTAAIGTDSGHPFTLLGPDSITGKTNGFLNIVPDMGSVATLFGGNFVALGSSNVTGLQNSLLNYFTVAGFTSGATLQQLDDNFAALQRSIGGVASGSETSFTDLNFATGLDMALGGNGDLTVYNTVKNSMTGKEALAYFGNLFGSNLYNSDASLNSAFEYMDRTPFTTFDTFINAKSRYKYDMPTDSDVDYAMKYSNTTKNGINYSLNYAYQFDKNPIIDLYWENDSGTRLTTTKTNITLTDGTKTAKLSMSGIGSAADEAATLVFDQKVKRIHNIGGSFDMAVETDNLGPVVIRGEAVYMKDTYSPVMDRGSLSIGDLPAALTMRKGDRFKYVLGADITALTNMMVSVQFIQDRNLDHIDSNKDWNSETCSASATNCGVYTTDYATMHLTNGFNKAEKNKDFVSLFLSKPFGESGQHRWNNITMFEDTGGRWNRLDVEYTIDDNTIATAEYNKYWGDKNTQFGQLEKSSNIQVGLKYTF